MHCGWTLSDWCVEIDEDDHQQVEHCAHDPHQAKHVVIVHLAAAKWTVPLWK